MKKLDLSTWERKEIFDFMSGLSDPFFTVCFNIDVTDVYEYSHRHHLSFYYSLIFLVSKALNEVPAFLNDIVENEIVVRDQRNPSFCDIRKGSEAFYIVNALLGENIAEFCERAQKASLASKSFYPEGGMKNEAWIYFSCIPWLDVTCITNERNFDPDDTVPRVSWGKYTDCNGRKKLNISIEANHRFIDGYHIGMFEKQLSEKIALLREC